MTVTVLSRRSVLIGGAVTVAAGVVGFAVARGSDAARPKGQGAAANGYGAPPNPPPAPLVRVDQVPSNGGVIVASRGVVVTRDQTGALHAFSATCTHQGCTVAAVAKGTIDCPCHGSRFDVTTGAPVAGPATRPLPKVTVAVRDGEVYTA